jgi:hypothetical protein
MRREAAACGDKPVRAFVRAAAANAGNGVATAHDVPGGESVAVLEGGAVDSMGRGLLSAYVRIGGRPARSSWKTVIGMPNSLI